MFRVLSLLLLLLFAHQGGAEAFVDPMRPYQLESGKETTPVVKPAGGQGEVSKPLIQTPVRLWLQSILIGPARSRAVINGQMVSIGDRVGTATVTQIEHDRVSLLRGNSVITLSLTPLSIKE